MAKGKYWKLIYNLPQFVIKSLYKNGKWSACLLKKKSAFFKLKIYIHVNFFDMTNIE